MHNTDVIPNSPIKTTSEKEEKTYSVINILADDALVNIEEDLTPEKALLRYLELKKFTEDIDVSLNVPKSLIFLIEGKIIKKNKK
jgi:hypothetical protein